MEEKIKKIIAVFLQREPSEINSSTLINSSAIPGSILIHRMYRELSLAGFTVDKYIDINTYGDLINRLNGTSIESVGSSQTAISMPVNDSDSNMEIGIDIESIANFPVVNDYREDPFYKTNFTNGEISYCILKPTPIESFAGLFCLKEAICKTNEAFRKIPFNQLEITHTADGKPGFRGYALSVSHTKEVATGVAVIGGNNSSIDQHKEKTERMIVTGNAKASGNNAVIWLSVIALLLSAAAIGIVFLLQK